MCEWGFRKKSIVNERGFACNLRLHERGFGIYYHLGGIILWERQYLKEKYIMKFLNGKKKK